MSNPKSKGKINKYISKQKRDRDILKSKEIKNKNTQTNKKQTEGKILIPLVALERLEFHPWLQAQSGEKISAQC